MKKKLEKYISYALGSENTDYIMACMIVIYRNILKKNFGGEIPYKDEKLIEYSTLNTILYEIKNEFENEVDTIEDATDENIKFALEMLDGFVRKLEFALEEHYDNENREYVEEFERDEEV